MKTLPFWLGLACLGLALPSVAQTDADALRYSWQQFGGTARTQAIGGATTAVGADLGVLSTNPAGLCLYRQSEFSFTPGLGFSNTTTSGVGSPLENNRSSLHIGSVGVVFTNRLADNDNSSDWRGSSFAIGATRINDFNSRFHYKGNVADRQTFFEYLRESPATQDDLDAEYGQNGENITTLDGLGYGAYLTNVNQDEQGRDYVSTINRSEPVLIDETVSTTGSQTQYDFGYGASYRDKVYLGASLGVVRTRYNLLREYSEAEDDANTAFTSLLLRDEVNTTGTGLNVRAGVIYRASDQLRIGASVQTPTFSSLTETYKTSLSTNFSGLQVTNSNGTVSTINDAMAVTRPGESNYTLTSPFRANVGGALVVGKNGFVSADVEYVNYGQARLHADNEKKTADESYFDEQNQAVADKYKSAVNVRLGGELRADIFRFRLGYALYGDPFKSNEADRTRAYYTGGVGLRQKNTFIDLSGVYTTGSSTYSPFNLANGQQPRLTIDEHRFTTSFTVGKLF
ncbi:OmpP1/FadL family transporter [Hymenobacter sp. DG25A]|uniref:OmpP1/FadL family transporter n=1 Tax=Hymenobacter sp. DG25A TaxID=1385663 RepID=UPI0006BDB434|nr:hypothetical protein [Hymenobacter sp. DG25A]ALD22051.1 hypothetical protein AM218_13555 [Hymenobacter sp. DG25A]